MVFGGLGALNAFDIGYFQLMMGLLGCKPTVNQGRTVRS